MDVDSVDMSPGSWCSLKGPRRVCCFVVDPEKSGPCVKKLLLGWLFFAVFSKIVAFYVLATFSYSSVWQSVVNLYQGNSGFHSNHTIYLSNAFGAPGLLCMAWLKVCIEQLSFQRI